MSKLCFLHRHIRTKDKYYMPMVFSEAIFVLFSHGALSFRSPCFLWIDITGKPCGSFIILTRLCSDLHHQKHKQNMGHLSPLFSFTQGEVS